MHPPDLRVIIISWNVRDLLRDCLTSVLIDIENGNLAADIWVVDNASADDSLAMIQAGFPAVKLIASEENLGFAGGNNAAMRVMGFPGRQADQPGAVLLLNPDTIVCPGALKAMLDFVEARPEAGIVGGNLSFGDGSFQHGAYGFPGLWQLAIELFPLPGRFYESRLNGRYDRALYEGDIPFPIDHPLGAALLVRREAIWQVGLMDEGYHMYVEEVDWCKRIKLAGWGAYCVPQARIIHFGGQSTAQVEAVSLLNLWRSRHRFYTRYYSGLKAKLAQALVYWGMARKIKAMPAQAEMFRMVQKIWQGESE